MVAAPGRVLSVLLAVASLHTGLGQYAQDHVGNFEDFLDGYRIQYHDQSSLLMIINSLDCFVASLQRGTPVVNKLEDMSTRMSTQKTIVGLIRDGHFTATSLGDVLEAHPDVLLRALCFRSEIYNIDLSLLHV